MNFKQFNKLPDKVKNGEMTPQDGCKTIWETVFRNKQLFGLTDLNEDDFQELLLYFYERLGNVFENYKPEGCTFYTYIYSRLCKNKMNFFYLNGLKDDNEKIMKNQANLIYEMDNEQYLNQEYSMTLENQPMICASRDDVITEKDREFLEFMKESYPKCIDKTQKVKNLKKAALFINALKYSNHLNEKLIKKIAEQTGLSSAMIVHYSSLVRNEMAPKLDKRKMIFRKIERNYAYYHRFELQIRKKRSADFDTVSERKNEQLKRHLELWTRSLKKLGKENSSTTASVKIIEKVTHINQRHLKYIINHYSEKIDKEDEKM